MDRDSKRTLSKSSIKNFAVRARNILRAMAEKEAGFYGVTKEGFAAPVQSGADFETYKTLAGTEHTIYGADIRRRVSLKKAVEDLGFEQVIEETAYTWFNRIIAIRFMEVNDYLPTRVRVLSSENGGLTPDIVIHSMDVELNLTREELERVQEAKAANKFEDAYRILFIKQCNELNDILPGLFEKTDDYMELLLKVSYTGDSVIRLLVDTVAEDDFNVKSGGQVEIIGWMYQYYNSELKDDTFAKLKKNIKITKERIPAATQLFTPDWIVRYMVENSVGRVWIDHLRAVDECVDEKSIAEEYGWKYYLPEVEQEEDVAKQLVEIRKSYTDITPQDITCIDPCMGSGHILVYMFDVLMDIYKSEGYSERDAVFDILENNIFGLDIDRRAYQLSYFALMMKGRKYGGRKFFKEGRIIAKPHVYAIEESNSVSRELLQYFGTGLDELSKKTAMVQMNGLLDTMKDAKEYGSILIVEDYDWKLLRSFVTETDTEGQMTVDSMGAESKKELMARLVEIGALLARKYDAVVTNPPYMASGGMNAKLHKYVKKHYKNCKSDLYATFIKRSIALTKMSGFCSMITQHTWMFLSRYEKMRQLFEASFVNMVHLGARAFDEISGEVVQTVAFSIRNSCIIDYDAIYIRLVDYSGEVSKEAEFFEKRNRICSKQSEFMNIPGYPIAYWASKRKIEIFRIGKPLKNVAIPRVGLITGDNTKFIRVWWEVEYFEIEFGLESYEQSKRCNFKWYPYNKGGSARSWFGNRELVVFFKNGGADIEKNGKETGSFYFLGASDVFFKKGITWNGLASNRNTFRFSPTGSLFDSNKGPMVFPKSEEMLYYLIGLFNSKVTQTFLSILNPSISLQAGDFEKLPVLASTQIKDVGLLCKQFIDESIKECDSLETSLDFQRQPLLSVISKNHMLFVDTDNINLADCFACWKKECDDRFNQLKANEEELNRMFINIYGLQEELTPEVEEKDITVRKADLGRDIRSLISYAVGCMFGRYSIVQQGLVYAGGEFDSSKYGCFPAEDDAIIPITDEVYFDDDIVGRFEEFIRTVYGAKSLEDNLKYIAEALGTKGLTAREKIRNYFLKDFFRDHCNVYSVTGSGKRPIYWLFDSGRQNGFKALIYMHRYTPDTVGLVRSVYLKKVSDAIEVSLKNAEYIISEKASAVDVAQATKKRDKYVKQLAEIKPYYQALSHVAMQRIPLDLDDGVKVNYAKFQGIEVAEDGGKRQTINLLAKI